MRDDTSTQYSKNDCELNAGKRLLKKIKTQFPKRSFCIVADNLFAVDPIVSIILEKGWHLLLTAKPEKNKELFSMHEYLHENQKKLELIDQNGTIHRYCWSNQLPLKQYKQNETVITVSLLQSEEINPDGEIVYQSSWITDFTISEENVSLLARAARSRFVIENRNFNEQKNLGFQTEHNFGHFGNLPNVFFGLAQIAQLIAELFSFWKTGRIDIATVGSKRRYFERLAVKIGEIVLPDDSLPILYLKFDFNTT